MRATTGCSSTDEFGWSVLELEVTGGETADASLLASLAWTELEDDSLLAKAGGLITSREGVVDVVLVE